MIRVALQSVAPGQQIGQEVYDEDGQLLLGRGVSLDKYLIKRLEERGVDSLYINDGEHDDILPYENISSLVRGSTIRHLKGIFNTLDDIRSEVVGKAQDEIVETISSARFQSTFAKHPEFEKLKSSVVEIVEDILNGEMLIGLNSLKTFDNYLFQHSIDVAVLGVMMGRRIGLPVKRLRELAMGCILHDMGKLFIPREILDKPEKLTDHEMEIVKKHPLIGYELIKNVSTIGLLPPHVALQHHEHQDGSGYPRRLNGKNNLVITQEPKTIHLYGSICAVADVYDACTSDRPYRKAMKPEQVVKLIKDLGKKHLNKEVVRLFLSITPVYPIGTVIRIVKGRHINHFGIVVDVQKQNLDKPHIRIYYDPRKKKLRKPIDLFLREHPDVEIETCVL